MSIIWKALFGLALALPLSAFVAGVLVASSAEQPAPRETIVIRDSGMSDSSQGPRDGRSHDDQPGPEQPTARPDDSEDPDDTVESPDDDADDTSDTVQVVQPDPETVGDDDTRDTRDVADDNSGPGGGDEPETRDDGGEDTSGSSGDDGDDTGKGGDDD